MIPSRVFRVLVVEDNAVNRLVAQNVLESLGHEVELVAGGQEALDWLCLSRPDVVFMDCQMPGMDGYETTRRIRAGEAGPDAILVPVVALTAHALPTDRRLCLDAGMDDYLTKPFVAADLQQVLDQLPPNTGRPALVAPVAPQPPPERFSPDAVDPEALAVIEAMGTGPDAPYQRILETYLASAAEDIGRIRAALDAADADALRSSAHRLKGASLQMGAKAVGMTAAKVEGFAASSDLAAAELCFEVLASQLDEAMRWIRDRLGLQPEAVDTAPDAAASELPLALVVDDDPTMRGLVARVLGSAGFEVREAADGPSAIAAFVEEPADIVLLDVLMEGMDGYDACRALRATPGGESVPVLILSGLDDEASIRAAYESGATDFITKPFKSAILANRARYGLRAARAVAESGERLRAELDGGIRAELATLLEPSEAVASGGDAALAELERIRTVVKRLLDPDATGSSAD